MTWRQGPSPQNGSWTADEGFLVCCSEGGLWSTPQQSRARRGPTWCFFLWRGVWDKFPLTAEGAPLHILGRHTPSQKPRSFLISWLQGCDHMQHVAATLLSDVVDCVSADAGADRHFCSSVTNTVSVLCGRSLARSCLGGLGLVHLPSSATPVTTRSETRDSGGILLSQRLHVPQAEFCMMSYSFSLPLSVSAAIFVQVRCYYGDFRRCTAGFWVSIRGIWNNQVTRMVHILCSLDMVKIAESSTPRTRSSACTAPSVGRGRRWQCVVGLLRRGWC